MTKILVDKLVLEQAMEALEADNSKLWPSDRRTAAYFNLRAALAEPMQEPVACSNTFGCRCPKHFTAEPVQEPVAYVDHADGSVIWKRGRLPGGSLLYASPPQRKPLTEGDMYIVEEEAMKNFHLSQSGPRAQTITYWDSPTPWLIRAVERAHRIGE